MSTTTVTMRLGELAHARSGDKGRGANIGVIAYSPAIYAFLGAALTPERVAKFLAPLGPGTVTRYALPNLHAYNFLLPEILDGGGSRSLRSDAQGKALGQILLEMELEVPAELISAREGT